MNISLNWLNTYLDRPVDADKAEHVLTELGFPLDGREDGDDDVLLDVEVTSNRGDCLSHVGVAREIAAATDHELKFPDCTLPAENSDAPVEKLSSVANEAVKLCPLYTARVIRGVKVAESPDWLKQRIEAIGLRPVNNVVDVTNFVLFELGQPLHAFDMALLNERRIVVRTAGKGEPFTAIDGSKHELRDDMLVIADADQPVAVAGVMGGLDSEVGERTTDVLLESARFDPLSIRTTSRSLKLSSDASYRFERGVDPAGVERASRRAARLIVEAAGGTLAEGVIAEGEPLPDPRHISLQPERCNELLGYELSRERIAELLAPLGLQPEIADGQIHCTVPLHRLDLEREVDLVEEVARVHGYEHLEIKPRIAITAQPVQAIVQARRRVIEVLTAHGFHETVTFSNLPAKDAAPFFARGMTPAKLDDERRRAEPVLRPSVLPSLLRVRKGNQDVGNDNVRLFELAGVYAVNNGEYAESRDLALLMDGGDNEALREFRSTMNEIARVVGKQIEIAEDSDPTGSMSPAARIMDANQSGRILGLYGPVTNAILRHFDLQQPVVMGWLDYEALIADYPPRPQVSEQPRFPAVERDLSIVVDEETRWAKIESAIAAVDPALLEDVQFVGVYRGKPIAKGRKSVSFRMTFRDPGRTLESEEVDAQVNDVVSKLGEAAGAELRAQ